MNLSDVNIAQFFLILRDALWGGEEVDLQHVVWSDVMRLAKEQAVFGLVFDVLSTESPKQIDNNILYEWIGISEQIKRNNEFLNSEVSLFLEFLAENKIQCKVVKGQTVSSCYPKAYLRQSGDVDFWVPKDKYVACENVIERKLGLVLQRQESEKHVEFRWHGVQYELHSHLAMFHNKKQQRYFDDLVESDTGLNVKIGDIEMPTLSPTLNALYIFVHLFFHLIHVGVGLRQFCDWMMWLHQYKNDIERRILAEHLAFLGLYRPYCVLGAILVDNLGLPSKEFPFEINEKDRKRSRQVLKDIIALGNFGHNNERIQKLGFLHSLHTGWRMCSQSFKYLDLAPKEVLLRVPYTVIWYLKKLFKIHFVDV